MDKKLVMYELRRHGEDEVEFYDIEDLFFALLDAGFQVERHFYEDGEFSNEEIQKILSKEGLHSLPIAVMDEKPSIKGRYPTLDEIGHYFNIEISYQPDTECCTGEDDCCCCGGHAQEDPEYEGHDCCCGHHHHEEEHECCCGHHHEEEHECCCGDEEEHDCCCHNHEE